MFPSFSSVTQSSPTLCDPVDCSMPGFPVHHQLPELTQTHVHRVGDAIQPPHLLLSVFFLPSISPSIRVFSNESILHFRWPKYWNFRAVITIHSDIGVQENKISLLLPFSCQFARSDGTKCHDLSFFNVEFQDSFFTLLLYSHQEALQSLFTFYHQSGVCISETVNISPCNLDFSL